MLERLAHYRILHPLGSGGMGEVYLAEDLHLNRKVALKVLRTDEPEGSAGSARFLREAQAIAQLDHPNVCAVYEYGTDDHLTYIAMQYIEGQSLSEWMQGTSHEPGAWFDFAYQVLDALEEAHVRGILHRDVKPQNILITPKGQAKVLDFGLAKRILPAPAPELGPNLTNPGMVIGTVPYMSPEQVRGEPLDGRSDLFSFGVVLFELATGRRPFVADSGVELMSCILTQDPFEAPVSLPPGLRRVLERALAKDPRDRYPTAHALKVDLRKVRAEVTGAPATWETGLRGSIAREFRARWEALGTRGPGLRVGVLLTMALAIAGLFLGGLGRSQPSKVNSIAVLPILNQSGDPGMEYLSDGLTENLIAQLSHLPNLKVIARASVVRYKGSEVDLRKVGRELNVAAVLVGRMRMEKGQLQLNLELADTTTLHRLWGVQALYAPSDLINLQTSLADQVANHLGWGDPEGRQAIARAQVRTTSSDAYDLYLRGRFHADRWLPAEVDKAIQYFDRALALDPTFVLPHVGKANAYWGLTGSFRPGREVLPKAKAEAEAALALDPRHPEALSIRAIATMGYDRDFASANRDFQLALRLAPDNPIVLQSYGYALMGQCHAREGIRFLQKAVEADPLSPIAWAFLSFAQQTAGDLPASNQSARRLIALEPGFFFGHVLLGLNQEYGGKTEEALKELELAAASGSPMALAVKGKVLASAGRRKAALQILKDLKARQAAGGLVSPMHLALVYEGLGDQKTALEQLKIAAEQREEEVIAVPSLRHWQEVRDSPGYPAFLRSLDLKGFTPAPAPRP